MWLKKHKGGSAVGPHEWKKDGDVTEVPDRLGEDLLRIDPHGYEAVAEPAEAAPEGRRAEGPRDREDLTARAPPAVRLPSPAGGAMPDADSPVPLCTPSNFTSSAFADLVAGYSDTALEDLMSESTRACEAAAGGRRLAPFTITETTRADGVDPDEYPAGASLPMPIQGTIGWSEALALGGGNDLVRHCWLTQAPPRYPDLWQYSDVSVTVIRSYSGTQQYGQAQLLDGPDNTGHIWFQIGSLVPIGSRVRTTYSGGYTVAIPADLVRAGSPMAAWMVLSELDPQDSGRNPDRLYGAACKILEAYK